MLRFMETFYRHRKLLVPPVVVVFVLAVGWVLIQPRSYDASVRLWAERGGLVSVPDDNTWLTIAQVEAGVLDELLATKYFCVKVSHLGPLRDYIRAEAQRPPSTLTKIEAKVGLASYGPVSESQLDELAFRVISSSTTVVPAGAEVVTITFQSNNPVVAAKMAQAIADQFLEETLSSRRLQLDASIAFYTNQLKTAQADVAAADKAVNDYLGVHPEYRAPTAVPDARLAQLRRDDDAAHQSTNDIQKTLDQSNISRSALSLTGVNGLRVMDPAEIPTKASSIRKTALVAAGVATGLGLLIVVVGVLVLTLADGTVRQPEEVQQLLDLRPVGTVPKLRRT